jgi:predicted nucleotide-binding protein
VFNLLVSGCSGAWKSSPVEFSRSRVIIEYTASEIQSRYKELTQDVVNVLKQVPTLFVVENEQIPSYFGKIEDIAFKHDSVLIYYSIDQTRCLPCGVLKKLSSSLDIGKWELSRTHWAIKDLDLYNVLAANGFDFKREISASPEQTLILNPEQRGKTSKVFIVHGHDVKVKEEVELFIKKIGLDPVVLHRQASGGKTIIEKLEDYTDVDYGVVLYTPCDVGGKKDTHNYSLRARQNVVFEHGYLIAKLGRDRVCAMVKGGVEKPNDISGVVYVEFDDQARWKEELTKELQAVGCIEKTLAG